MSVRPVPVVVDLDNSREEDLSDDANFRDTILRASRGASTNRDVYIRLPNNSRWCYINTVVYSLAYMLPKEVCAVVFGHAADDHAGDAWSLINAANTSLQIKAISRQTRVETDEAAANFFSSVMQGSMVLSATTKPSAGEQAFNNNMVGKIRHLLGECWLGTYPCNCPPAVLQEFLFPFQERPVHTDVEKVMDVSLFLAGRQVQYPWPDAQEMFEKCRCGHIINQQTLLHRPETLWIEIRRSSRSNTADTDNIPLKAQLEDTYLGLQLVGLWQHLATNLSSGHYISHWKCFDTTRGKHIWKTCNDRSVEEINDRAITKLIDGSAPSRQIVMCIYQYVSSQPQQAEEALPVIRFENEFVAAARLQYISSGETMFVFTKNNGVHIVEEQVVVDPYSPYSIYCDHLISSKIGSRGSFPQLLMKQCMEENVQVVRIFKHKRLYEPPTTSMWSRVLQPLIIAILIEEEIAKNVNFKLDITSINSIVSSLTPVTVKEALQSWESDPAHDILFAHLQSAVVAEQGLDSIPELSSDELVVLENCFMENMKKLSVYKPVVIESEYMYQQLQEWSWSLEDTCAESPVQLLTRNLRIAAETNNHIIIKSDGSVWVTTDALKSVLRKDAYTAFANRIDGLDNMAQLSYSECIVRNTLFNKVLLSKKESETWLAFQRLADVDKSLNLQAGQKMQKLAQVVGIAPFLRVLREHVRSLEGHIEDRRKLVFGYTPNVWSSQVSTDRVDPSLLLSVAYRILFFCFYVLL